MSLKDIYEQYVYDVWFLDPYSIKEFSLMLRSWMSVEDIIKKTPDKWRRHNAKNPVTYKEYIQICDILEYTPFSMSLFHNNFNKSDFWAKHKKISITEIGRMWEKCLTIMDRRYINTLPTIHSVRR